MGSALPATSGTPRPPCPLGDAGTWLSACQAGGGNSTLTPPPLAPSPALVSFQTTSLVMVVPEPSRRVPPQPSTYGLEAGKSTCAAPSLSPSLEPLSPLAAVTVTPSPAASSSALCIAARDCAVQPSSGPP